VSIDCVAEQSDCHWRASERQQRHSLVRPGLAGGIQQAFPHNGATGVPLSVTLSWAESSAATSYEYCIDTVNNNSCDTSWTPTTALDAVVSGLASNTLYYWQVRARNGSAPIEANASAWWSFTTQPSQQPWWDPSWPLRRSVAIAMRAAAC